MSRFHWICLVKFIQFGLNLFLRGLFFWLGKSSFTPVLPAFSMLPRRLVLSLNTQVQVPSESRKHLNIHVNWQCYLHAPWPVPQTHSLLDWVWVFWNLPLVGLRDRGIMWRRGKASSPLLQWWADTHSAPWEGSAVTGGNFRTVITAWDSWEMRFDGIIKYWV